MGFKSLSVRQPLIIMHLLIATRNADKLKEIRSVFELPGLTFSSALDHPKIPEVEEDGATAAENSKKKAKILALETGHWALADDTSLEVEALDGAPGIYAARYAGENATYADNVRKLLNELSGIDNRSARFRSVISLSDPAGSVRHVEGEIRGSITSEPRGSDGFGYDPVFLPEGESRTFAEMPEEEKNQISHRAIALRKAQQSWASLLLG
jgi:XTP/dITP diphosphohydrolase